jgi:hypothetical protein
MKVIYFVRHGESQANVDGVHAGSGLDSPLTEKSIRAAASKLGFTWADAKFGKVDVAYMAQYPKMTAQDSIGAVPEVCFALPLPGYLKERS